MEADWSFHSRSSLYEMTNSRVENYGLEINEPLDKLGNPFLHTANNNFDLWGY